MKPFALPKRGLRPPAGPPVLAGAALAVACVLVPTGWAAPGSSSSAGSRTPASNSSKGRDSGWTGGASLQLLQASKLQEGAAGVDAGPASPEVPSPIGTRASDLGAARLPVASVEVLRPAEDPRAARTPQTGADKAEETPEPISIPLVAGYDSFGLTIPDHDEAGRLRSVFVIGAVSRMDDRTVQIRETFLETYRQDGSKDLCIDLPKATLDRFTRLLSTSDPVTIRREEFELKGASLEFNTLTRRGELNGPVEMTLYNFQVEPSRPSPSGHGGGEKARRPSAGGGRASSPRDSKDSRESRESR